MLKTSLLCIVFINCLLVLPAAAEEITLEPSQDAFVCDCIPGATNPMLGNQYLAQGRYSACYNRSFIQWDLSSIPEGATIDDAEFRIFCATFYGSPSGQMAYYRVIEAWNENTVTYTNRPDHTTDGALFTSSWPGTSSWHVFDVTSFVALWFGGTVDNFGMLCHSTGCTSTSDCAFRSSNVGNPGYRPRLVITYTPPSSLDETTWGGVKVMN
jgi:hypothetical protein